MADSVERKVEKREGRGTRKARHLRASGLVPGVVYGHKQETIQVAVPADELVRVIRHGAHVVDLRLAGPGARVVEGTAPAAEPEAPAGAAGPAQGEPGGIGRPKEEGAAEEKK